MTFRRAASQMTPEIEKAAGILESAGRAVVMGHQFPDGDAIGSVLGLGLMLQGAGREVQASWAEPFDMPEKYSFLPGAELLRRPTELDFEGSIAIALDCANEKRLEELKDRALAVPLINIDHHPDNTQFGQANITDPMASSTSQIVCSVAGPFGLGITPDVATCLYTGLVTDTGRFQFSNVTADTLRIAAGLVDCGVDPHVVYENVYQSDSLNYLRLSGEVLCRSVYESELGLIHGYVSRDDLKRFGVRMNETEDLIDNLRTLRGHRIVALLKEQPDGRVRVSLRSRSDVDIGTLARSFGGGGHRVAAGYTSSKTDIGEAMGELKEKIIDSGLGPDNR